MLDLIASTFSTGNSLDRNIDVNKDAISIQRSLAFGNPEILEISTFLWPQIDFH